MLRVGRPGTIGRVGTGSDLAALPDGRIRRVAVALAAAVGVAVAVAIALGELGVPELAGVTSGTVESLGAWAYLVVPALAFLETLVLVGFAIPGELVIVVGGIAAERGEVAAPVMFALVSAALVAGDLVSFALGRRLGRRFLEAHGPRVRIGAPQLARIDGLFARHCGKAVLLGHFVGGLRALMPFVAGASHVSLSRFLRFSIAGALALTGVFTLLGYASSEPLARAGDTATRVALAAVLLTAVAVLVRARRPTAAARPSAGG